MDIFTRKNLIVDERSAAWQNADESGLSPLRFTWEFKNPSYYRTTETSTNVVTWSSQLSTRCLEHATYLKDNKDERGPAAEHRERVDLGGSQLGIHVAQALEAQDVRVKLFERDRARAERVAAILHDTTVVNADGTDEATLEEAGAADVQAFLALTKDDENNIIASMLARRLGVKKVVALINRLDYLPLAQRLGVNATVSPRLAVVDRALQFVRKGRVGPR